MRSSQGEYLNRKKKTFFCHLNQDKLDRLKQSIHELSKAKFRDYGCFLPGQGASDDILVEEWREAMVAHVLQVFNI